MQQILDQIAQAISRHLQQNTAMLIAIDGNCTAGKTTLAAALAQKYDCNVLHMDDFFLQGFQRTPQRLAETGGNVDYERFLREVLRPLTAGETFSYRPYDCSRGDLSDPVPVQPRKINIVEGTYSQHPYFGDVYDLKIFLSVDPEVQRKRILERPAFLHRRFFQEWIPMEQQYFTGFGIWEKSHLHWQSQQGKEQP